MSELKQFAITLFNLQLWNKDKSKAPTRTDEWMDGRLALFERYTLPSMRGQTLKDYTWLCLFDKETPRRYLDKIEEYKRAVPQFTPLFFTKYQAENLSASLHDAMLQFLSGEEKFILTTNIDNDDSVDFEMLSRVRREVGRHIQRAENDEEVCGLYNCLYGYQYFISKGMILKMMYPHNHFQTLCETPGDFRTIKGFPHTKIRKLFRNHDITDGGKPYWMEIVHSRNVNNDYRIDLRLRNIPVFRSVSLCSFGLDKVLSRTNNTVKSLFVIPGLFAVTAAKGIRRHLFKKKRK